MCSNTDSLQGTIKSEKENSVTNTHTNHCYGKEIKDKQIAAEHDNTAGSYDKPNNSDQN
jgi:hypothetical protein